MNNKNMQADVTYQALYLCKTFRFLITAQTAECVVINTGSVPRGIEEIHAGPQFDSWMMMNNDGTELNKSCRINPGKFREEVKCEKRL